MHSTVCSGYERVTIPINIREIQIVIKNDVRTGIAVIPLLCLAGVIREQIWTQQVKNPEVHVFRTIGTTSHVRQHIAVFTR